ncbi:tetratricopeptide repeat protein [Streptomyces sp. NBC_01275]|uniref:tetratricopeptide repeat protein n=1 Tax=Streptomyces sp. NBC_01275 TaxID=2903807 RepID=UPI00224D03F2|nr:tetratricopeptide repeat protein [Streptomyces sp. NBC_01275]MCX4767214.1 tetratricopeptide repeat protein [Streptomyces sp. NBC_01275]
MGDLGALFTDRRAALSAVRALAEEGGRQRVLLLTGLSGMGKSTVLAYVQARPPRGWTCAVVDAEAVVSGMAVRTEGAEEAALQLLRSVGGHLAALGPWWRRRWLRQRAASIGRVRPLRVSVRQWAGFGGRISNAPVHVTAGALSQGQRRGEWTDQLLAVARGVRRGRLVLMVDTCERLAYFDDVRAERPRPGQPYGVGGWFNGVLDQLLDAMPYLRVVLAGTTTPAMATTEGSADHRVGHVELQPWKPGDTRRYLARRGLQVDAEVAAAVTDAEGGLPVTISWIADVLSGLLTDGTAGIPPAEQVLAQLTEPTGPSRTQWLRQHVLDRLSEGTLHLLRAAAVLDAFTPAALLTVAGTNGPADSDAFTRLSRTSCISPHIAGYDGEPGPGGRWRLHAVMRRWLIEDARAHDAQQPPARRTLPALHRAAAEYHEALAGDGGWSLDAARHRFATGDDIHAAAWTTRLTAALQTTPPNILQIQLLTDAVLNSEDCGKSLPAIAADAHLASGFVAYDLARYPSAQDHAEQALALYRTLGARSRALYLSACLAGQAAWKRPRYQDAVEHWTTALTHHPVHTGVGVAGPDDLCLHTALVVASLRTGNARRTRTLLDQPTSTPCTGQPVADSSDSVGADQSGPAVEYALPAFVLGELIAPEQHAARLHLLHAETALVLDEYDQAADHAHRILDDPVADRHHTALAHRLLARIALSAWSLDQAGRHLRDATTEARRCSDRRCLVHVLLTRGTLARLKTVWSPPRESASAVPASLSLAQRAESAHQEQLAARELSAAADLAADLDDPLLQAHAMANTDPDAALVLYRTIGNQLGEADTLYLLADTARMHGDLDSADRCATQAATLHRLIGNRSGEADALRVLADTAQTRGDLEGANRHATQALALHRALGNRQGQAHTLYLLADATRMRSDLDGADRCAAQALALYRAIGHLQGQAHILRLLAGNARTRGDLDRAHQYATQALTVYRTIGHRSGEADALRVLSGTARDRGDLGGTDRCATQALALYRAIGHRSGEANVLRLLADTAQTRGDLDGADRHSTQALALFRTVNDRLGEAEVLSALATSARIRGDLKRADRHATQALALFRTIDDRLGEADVLSELAEIAWRGGRTADGRRHMEAAAALCDTLGMPKRADSYRKKLRKW